MSMWKSIPGFDEKMDIMNQKMEMLLTSEDRLMTEVMGWLMSNRGKQLRPAMVLLCASFGTWSDKVPEVAAMVEITHMASLVHDDIIDDADERRGQPSVQKKYGKKIAVYAGDFMVFSGLSRMSFVPTKRQFGMYRTLVRLCEGELLQFENFFNVDQTEEAYFTQIGGKTVTLFQMACKMGAIEGKCRAKTVRALEEYGRLFGNMFQIQDDILDFVGDSNMGKATRRDIAEGVYTLPVIYALQDPEVGPRLRETMLRYNETRDAGLYDQIYELIGQTDGIARTVALMEDYNRRAQKQLAGLPDTPERAMLSQMAEELYNIVARAAG